MFLISNIAMIIVISLKVCVSETIVYKNGLIKRDIMGKIT